MNTDPHVLMNGLCVATGGGFSVAREMLGAMARQKPDWRFTLVLSDGKTVHREFNDVAFPPNVSFLWAPAWTANRALRFIYENSVLAKWAKRDGVTAALQVNGMMIPTLEAPTFSHAEDPWPYRRDLWSGDTYESTVTLLKRYEHARALRNAPFIGWTSSYLRDLVCDYHGIEPKNSEVLLNGLPEDYRLRAAGELPPWSPRPMEILTVSNVLPYKRQSLVIEALAGLVRRSGFESLRYRILGAVAPSYKLELEHLAKRLGVAANVIIEGRVSQERIEHCLSQARAFAFMSVCECFGIPPLEAMSFGTPVVSADCCSAREIYGDAVEYCRPDDVDALTDKLEMIFTDEHRVNELRALGAARTQLYSWERTAGRIALHLSDLMA
ncbi:MAG: glycosyltransferase [Acidobacteriota bacterium]|nr:glycosyltransferase [Acidobacteriota bacterium]